MLNTRELAEAMELHKDIFSSNTTQDSISHDQLKALVVKVIILITCYVYRWLLCTG